MLWTGRTPKISYIHGRLIMLICSPRRIEYLNISLIFKYSNLCSGENKSSARGYILAPGVYEHTV
jgi:hypothetical protein